MPKLKTNKAVKKRFKITKTGNNNGIFYINYICILFLFLMCTKAGQNKFLVYQHEQGGKGH